jgi:hypothetical protein
MTEHSNDHSAPAVLPASASQSALPSQLSRLAEIPEEEIWLAKQKSKRTRRAYKLDVAHFMRTLHITSYDELRQADHRAVIAWERIMREVDAAEPSTVRRRLAALSSLFKHLVRHRHVESNPVAEVERPAINRREGSTLAFSRADAARLLNTPAEDSVEGLRASPLPRMAVSPDRAPRSRLSGAMEGRARLRMHERTSCRRRRVVVTSRSASVNRRHRGPRPARSTRFSTHKNSTA